MLLVAAEKEVPQAEKRMAAGEHRLVQIFSLLAL